MPKPPELEPSELIQRIHRELIDSYDEELEMEIDDRDLDDLDAGGLPPVDEAERKRRRAYFQELFRLQGELVKLRDWVAHWATLPNENCNRPEAGSRAGCLVLPGEAHP